MERLPITAEKDFLNPAGIYWNPKSKKYQTVANGATVVNVSDYEIATKAFNFGFNYKESESEQEWKKSN